MEVSGQLHAPVALPPSSLCNSHLDLLLIIISVGQ